MIAKMHLLVQLGVKYTRDKYESLLKNKSRKTLNDDDLDFSGEL